MFQKIRKSLAAILTLAMVGAMLFPAAAFAQDPVSVTIPVEIRVSGSSVPADTEYKLVIEGLNHAPMPEANVITIKDGGSASFGPIQYTVPDDYQYRIYQDSEEKDRFTYDKTVYTITVQITNDSNGGLSANIIIGKEGSSAKSGDMVFNNTYTSAGGGGGNSGGGGGGSSSGGGGGRTDLTTDDTVTITDPGTPTAQIGDGDVPLSPGDVIDQIVDTIVPLAVLPKTGDGSISYAALLAILLVSGGLAGGMYWKRRKNENTAE